MRQLMFAPLAIIVLVVATFRAEAQRYIVIEGASSSQDAEVYKG